MRNVFAAVLVLVLLAFGALAVLRGFAANKTEERYLELKTTQDTEARSVLPRFRTIEAHLRADPFFTATRPDKDAGPYLNARMTWSPPATAAAGAPKLIASDITPELEKQLSTWDKAWPTHSADVDFSKLDFSWFGELHQYGTWDVTAAPSPVMDHLSGGWAAMPLPSFVGLLRMSKLRLMQGIATEKPLEAARDVRQLAWLAYRTETVVGGAIAAALLGQEQKAHAAWLAAGHAPVEGWTPMTADEANQFRAVVMASMSFTTPLLDAKIYDEAFAGEGVHPGLCAGLTERAGLLAMMRSMPGGERSALLKSMSPHLEPVAGCDLRLAKLLWEQHLPPLTAGAAGMGMGSSEGWEALATRLMPTDMLIETTLSIATPSGLSQLAAATDGGAP
jgi:hypothetical protein